MEKTYIAIDLKSFYASVECVDRELDALTTNLVVADETRTEKTICLAVTPSLKAHGISGRARLFEVIQAVKEINQKRFNEAFRRKLLPKDENGKYHFTSASFDAEALAADPALELSYIVAPPRMKLYEEISTKIFSIYMRYISPEDIHVYSIDECFIDATGYLNTYHMTAHELAMTMIREVLYETGITATAGIGTNLYLAKVAMDIVAKHVQSILSDWFSLYDELDDLLYKLDISNFSIRSSKAFYIDFVYNCARWYYTHPYSYDYAALELFPVDYFKENDIHDIEQEQLEELIRQIKNRAVIEYGDDYVDQDDITVTVTSDYNLDLELLLLDIDDEEQEQNPFGEDPYEDDYPEEDLDEYEYADIDSELLDDPILLMKWLEKQDKQGQ